MCQGRLELVRYYYKTSKIIVPDLLIPCHLTNTIVWIKSLKNLPEQTSRAGSAVANFPPASDSRCRENVSSSDRTGLSPLA